MSERDPVQLQLDAYNGRDLDAFLACYAQNACIRDGHGEILLEGHAAIRQRYSALFDRHPQLHASLGGRLRAGSWTVDEERVVHDGESLHLLVAYRAQAGLIQDVVMLRSDKI